MVLKKEVIKAAKNMVISKTVWGLNSNAQSPNRIRPSSTLNYLQTEFDNLTGWDIAVQQEIRIHKTHINIQENSAIHKDI